MGPLAHLKIVEFAGIGPGPFCAMLFADLGATVIRIDRIAPGGLGVPKPARFDLLLRGRKALALDLKSERGLALSKRLVAQADGLIEGFRPGVMERLGLGPDTLIGLNPRLVYGRMTGWGQQGPLAKEAGHDLNYIAISGALGAIGRHDAPPTPPLNLAGDYAGAVYLAFGMVSAMLHANSTGEGQVVDAAICDTTAHLMTSFFGLRAAGLWSLDRGTNVLDSGAPYYDVYPCKDGRYISVAAIEPKFFAVLLHRLGIEASTVCEQSDRMRWPQLRLALSNAFLTRTRDDWTAHFAGSDACIAPVLSMDEAPGHPHFQARSTFVDIGGITQPTPQPMFSKTSPVTPEPPPPDRVQSAREALADWLPPDELATLDEALA